MKIIDVHLTNEAEPIELETFGGSRVVLPGPRRMTLFVNDRTFVLTDFEVEKMRLNPARTFPEMRAFAKGVLARRGVTE